MADEDIATRAPESDAAADAVKDSPFRGDSVAQEGPSMGVSLAQLALMGCDMLETSALTEFDCIGALCY